MNILKKSTILITFIGLISFSACYLPEKSELDRNRVISEREIEQYLRERNLIAQRTSSGLYYVVKQNAGNPRRVEVGEQITMHYIASLLSGRIFDSTSVANNKPLTFAYSNNLALFPLGVREGLKLIGTGDRVLLLLPSHLGFASVQGGVPRDLISIVPPFAPLLYDITFLSIKSETELIEDYIREKGLTVNRRTESGVYVIERLLGNTGKKPENNNKVRVNYVGRFLDDRIFDQVNNFELTVRDGKLTGRIIKAWDEVVPNLEKGDKVTIICPSETAYGANGTTNIPPFTPLVFDIEMVDIITP
ncbi:MAG: FKBP-type peptidyl-prolyl cis-trans isomerase [Microscillaceae bacterium]|nr:FKBP-type peptidyl-prolyl cis-trans isomerase [Microscillaceae bacterium]MDW8460967.1 FKBP-type peptidyl-prolyl cis-trans isomerase [Cytophagales bacterium]